MTPIQFYAVFRKDGLLVAWKRIEQLFRKCLKNPPLPDTTINSVQSGLCTSLEKHFVGLLSQPIESTINLSNWKDWGIGIKRLWDSLLFKASDIEGHAWLCIFGEDVVDFLPDLDTWITVLWPKTGRLAASHPGKTEDILWPETPSQWHDQPQLNGIREFHDNHVSKAKKVLNYCETIVQDRSAFLRYAFWYFTAGLLNVRPFPAKVTRWTSGEEWSKLLLSTHAERAAKLPAPHTVPLPPLEYQRLISEIVPATKPKDKRSQPSYQSGPAKGSDGHQNCLTWVCHTYKSIRSYIQQDITEEDVALLLLCQEKQCCFPHPPAGVDVKATIEALFETGKMGSLAQQLLALRGHCTTGQDCRR